MPPKSDCACDIEGAALYQRPDDSEETVLHRLSIYKKRTAPLINYYRERDLIFDIDASVAPDQTCELAIKALEKGI